MAQDAARAAGDHPLRVLCFATQGAGGNEEARIVRLLSAFSPVVWPYDRSSRIRGIWRLLREIRRLRPDLVVMEGSGSPGGLAIMIARLGFGVPYVVSSGDAIGTVPDNALSACSSPASFSMRSCYIA